MASNEGDPLKADGTPLVTWQDAEDSDGNGTPQVVRGGGPQVAGQETSTGNDLLWAGGKRRY